MRIYLMSLGAGLLVGVIYSMLNVRSPAPPVVALIGLLGILVRSVRTYLATCHKAAGPPDGQVMARVRHHDSAPLHPSQPPEVHRIAPG
jgi:XapX domain-containing protein